MSDRITSRQACSLLDSWRERLEGFERSLAESEGRAEELRERLVSMLREIEPPPAEQDLPPAVAGLVEQLAGATESFNRELLDAQAEIAAHERLVRRWEDSVVVGVIGRVKMGKSLLTGNLAKVLELGLGREVRRFALSEPTETVDVGDSLHKTVYAPWAGETIRPVSPRAHELLRRDGFVVSPEAARELERAGVRELRVRAGDEPDELPLERFKTGILETTMELQGLRSGRLVILDAPGLKTDNVFAGERARWVCAQSALSVFVTSSVMPLTAQDLEILRGSALASKRSVLFCLTRCDPETRDEDESGDTPWRCDWNESVVRRQTAWVESELEKARLSELLAEAPVVPVGSKLFERAVTSRQSRQGVEAAVAEGRYHRLLEALVEALETEGVRLKAEQPLRRAEALLRRVAAVLADLEWGSSRARSELRERLDRDLPELCERMRADATDELARLRRTALDEARASASKKRGTGTATIAKKKLREAFSRVAERASHELGSKVETAVSSLALEGLRLEVEEYWETDPAQSVEVGVDQSGRVLARGVGAAAGAAIAFALGPAGWLAGLTSLFFGGFVGGAVGEGLAAGSDTPVTVQKPESKRRVGDNAERVGRESDERLAEQVERFISCYTGALDAAVAHLEGWLDHLSADLGARRDAIDDILAESKERP